MTTPTDWPTRHAADCDHLPVIDRNQIGRGEGDSSTIYHRGKSRLCGHEDWYRARTAEDIAEGNLGWGQQEEGGTSYEPNLD